jgi:DNA-binding response OmpR family regulator
MLEALAGSRSIVDRGPVRSRFLLLVIDPDPTAAEPLCAQLPEWQVDVVVAHDTVEGLLQAGILLPDAVLTAADVPPISGSAVARATGRRAGIPTVVGVGEPDGFDATVALASGATACVARPYRVAELVRILHAISPDGIADIEAAVEVGALRLIPTAKVVYLHGVAVTMPARELELLHLLMLNAGRVVTWQQIGQLVWPRSAGGSRTVGVHIRRIRQRLGDDGAESKIIVSVRGMGYRLDPP